MPPSPATSSPTGPLAKLTKARTSTRIADATLEELGAAVRTVTGLLGLRAAERDGQDIEQQILTMTAYIRREYPTLPIGELTMAYRLYVKGDLWDRKNNPLTVIRLFDPAGLGEVLKAYERYRAAEQGYTAPPAPLALPDPGPSAAELDALLLADLTEAVRQVRAGKQYEDLGNGIYARLDEKGLIPFTDERKHQIYAEAVEQVRRQVVARSASAELTTGERRREKTLAEAIKQAGTITNTINPTAHGQAVNLAKQIALRYLIADLIDQETEPVDFLTPSAE